MVDCTTVVGIDARTVEQFRWAVPTWKKHRPELWTRPWLFFFDRTALTIDAVMAVVRDAGLSDTPVSALPWPTVDVDYPTQRERMLAGFIHAPAYVGTPWWLKIDTDAVALGPSDWAPENWFLRDPDADDPPDAPYASGYFVWIASAWGYTKPADQMARLDDWADRVPGLAEYPRLDLPYTPGGRRCRHPRMASWVSFYRTDWTRWAAGLARESLGPDRVPVPSQDGFHWYVATRRGDLTLRSSMRKRNWTNCPKLAGLVRTAQAVMAGNRIE